MEKYTLITGASGGIGEGFAHVFAENGHNVILLARSEDKLKVLAVEIEEKYNVKAMPLVADLSDMGSAKNIFEQLKDVEVNILVNNAGLGVYGYFHESNIERMSSLMHVNIFAMVGLTRLFGAEMAKRGEGKILNTASIAGFTPGPFLSLYYASKAFVLSLTESLSNEFTDFGVTVTALCPGYTETGFVKAAKIQGVAGEGSTLKGADPKDVAITGYTAMMSGKVVVIHGLTNKVLVVFLSLMPRKFQLWFLRRSQGPQEGR